MKLILSNNVSPNDAIHDNSAQSFHIDRDEHKQIKFYLYSVNKFNITCYAKI